MSTPNPSLGAAEPASAASPATGNEGGTQPSSSSEGRPNDYSKLTPAELIQQLVRTEGQLNERNRDLGGSKQEALRLKQESDQLRQAYEQLNTQVAIQRTQPPPEPSPQPAASSGDEHVSDAEMDAFSNAVIAGDKAGMRRYFDKLTANAEKRATSAITGKLTADGEKQATYAALNSAVDPKLWSDKDFVALALTKYQQVASNPGRMASHSKVDAPIQVGTVTLNASALREAAIEARADLLEKRGVVVPAGNDNVEPGTRTSTPIPGSFSTGTKIDPNNVQHVRQLLTPDEIAYVDSRGFTDKQVLGYFNNLSDGVRETRLREGKPTLAGPRGVKFTIPTRR